MIIRFGIALLLGAIIGIEREATGKEAGLRTAMLVSGGASIFTMIGVIIPYLSNLDMTTYPVLSDRIISNIVVGIGFLGAGIIIKTGEHVRGLTTAAVIWTTAAIGVLAGLGMYKFAFVAAFAIAFLLYSLKKMKLYEKIRPRNHSETPD